MDLLQFLWEIILALVQILLFMWPLTAFLILMGLIRGGMHIYKTHRYAKAGIADIDKLSGKEFEEYLEVFFKQLGYQVQRTPYQGDFGADLVLRRDDEKTVVQAKRYNRSVGVKAVQEAVASKEYYRCDKAMVVTNSYFSRQAQTLAKANQVELWNRDALVARLLSSKESEPVEFASLTSGLSDEQIQWQPATSDSATPTCAKCGKPLSTKVYEYCMSHADTFHGLTYCYEHQKELKNVHAIR